MRRNVRAARPPPGRKKSDKARRDSTKTPWPGVLQKPPPWRTNPGESGDAVAFGKPAGA
jgi:hypothetical protein